MVIAQVLTALSIAVRVYAAWCAKAGPVLRAQAHHGKVVSVPAVGREAAKVGEDPGSISEMTRNSNPELWTQPGLLGSLCLPADVLLP